MSEANAASAATDEFSAEVWDKKYRFHGDEHAPDIPRDESVEDTFLRVANAVFAKDDNEKARNDALVIMRSRDFVPGGRILAGAGTGRKVTLINCYVARTIEDSLPGIMQALNESAYTMQQGGGIGHDFSTIRPKGATVKGVGADASGPLTFMDTWDAMCQTIMSAGSRRGAMMATMLCSHPDIEEFITAKQTPGRLTNFNLSVLVTDGFMEAVRSDADWDLVFDGKVYRTVRARDLWNKIIESTYTYAEPGVIFIDRVNNKNNLNYCEDIRASNPCGEQMLPPYGACNLGAINLANMVLNPFTDDATFDFERLRQSARIAIRFLDNVLDITNYPLPEQRVEAQQKRRTGLGILGLGNALQMLRLRYGDHSVPMVRRIMAELQDAAYAASAELAAERGAFPLYDKEKFLASPNVQKLSPETRALVEEHGVRNGVLLTIAPTGTTAIFTGNISGGLEPTFAFRYFRKMRMPDGSHKECALMDRGWIRYCEHLGVDPETHPMTDLPEYMVSTEELSTKDHLVIQAACQEFIDASISKTINCPEDMSFEAFKQVYEDAFDLGCKGCTTYRPSGVRGAVLSTSSGSTQGDGKLTEEQQTLLRSTLNKALNLKRPDVLHGSTYKRKYNDANLYIVINDIEIEDMDGNTIQWPFEIFVPTTSPTDAELCDALTISITALFRNTASTKRLGVEFYESLDFLIDHLSAIQSPQGTWHGGSYIASRPAMIATALREHMAKLKRINAANLGLEAEAEEEQESGVEKLEAQAVKGELCKSCHQYAVVMQSGCRVCTSCGSSKCG